MKLVRLNQIFYLFNTWCIPKIWEELYFKVLEVLFHNPYNHLFDEYEGDGSYHLAEANQVSKA
jgi:hypothetical protein